MVDVEKYVKIVTGSRDSIQAEESNEVLDEVRWGNIIGSISDQADLYGILESKVSNSELATVATSGSYNDLTDKPIIPAAQVQSDWDEIDSSKADYIKNKPNLANVATSGDYDDLTNKPTIPAAQVNADWSASSGVSEILNKPTTLAGYGITDGANTDLSNLTDTGANIGNWSSNVTNYIASEAQNITMAIGGGSLTIKAGSKLYQPDGADTFTPVILDEDKTRSDFSSWASGIYMVFRSAGQYSEKGGITAAILANCVSGATDASTASTHFWYDTTNNKIKMYYSGSYQYDDLSLPIAIITVVNGTGVTNINQVFNCKGCIGNSAFVLSGITCVSCTGRNADGTLKNTTWTTDSVKVITASSISGAKRFVMNAGGNLYFIGMDDWVYNSDLNLWIRPSDGAHTEIVDLTSAIEFDSGKIINFKQVQPFHAVDYSDKPFIAHQGMPSDRYYDLTLPATGNTISMPADGYLVVVKAGSANEYLTMVNNNSTISCSTALSASTKIRMFMPVKRGDSVLVTYTASGTTDIFRLVYAEGAQ